MTTHSKILFLASLFAAAVSAGACGGQQPLAEAPASEAAPAEPSSTETSDAGVEGEHTMPDGSTMPGHEHGEGTPEHAH